MELISTLIFVVVVVVLDIDECTEETHSCDVNAVCNNTQGSYICTCKDEIYGDYTNEKI